MRQLALFELVDIRSRYCRTWFWRDWTGHRTVVYHRINEQAFYSLPVALSAYVTPRGLLAVSR